MFVIIKNLKKTIQVEDLHHFVKPAMKKGLFSKPGNIESIKIIKLVDKAGHIIEHHGLLRVSPHYKQQTIKAIKNLIPEKEHLIHEYVIRHWNNDRRLKQHSPLLASTERRQGERRRSGLRLVTLQA